MSSYRAAHQISYFETRIELVDGTRDELHARLAARKLMACISTKVDGEPERLSVELLREDYGLVVSLNHRFAFLRKRSVIRSERRALHCSNAL
jgi:hypothetical protein